MFTIGDSNTSQTLTMRDCIVYSLDTITEPIMYTNNLQECYFVNNKFLSSGYCNADLVICEGMTTTTFINNSFANTNNVALTIKSKAGNDKRISGNVLNNNMFENCKGENTIIINGAANTTAIEGYNNSIMNNDYLNSVQQIYINNVANSIIIDRANVVNGDGARRTFNINPYNSDVATKSKGHCGLFPDGDRLIGNYKGKMWVNVKGGLEVLGDDETTLYQLRVGTDGSVYARK